MLFLVYHKGCPDGCCAANSVMRFLREYDLELTLVPFSHNDEYTLPEGAAGSIFILVDFVYCEEVMCELLKISEKVFIIDHHQTAMDMNLKSPNLTSVIRNRKSASLLTWEILFEDAAPRYVELISDFDTGRHQIPESILLKYYMGTKRNLVPEFFDDAEKKIDSWLSEGIGILKKVEARAKKTYDRSKLYEFDGYTVLVALDDMDVLNYYNDSLASEIDFILFIRQNLEKKVVKVSVRSKKPIDLLKLNLWKGLVLRGHKGAAAGIIHHTFVDIERDLFGKMLKPSSVTKPRWKSLSEEITSRGIFIEKKYQS